MGHATHFLERLERLEGPALNLALDLYREPGLLTAVLKRLRLPEGEGHFALPLDEGLEPPHAIVSREGHFITCLGQGMRPIGARIVSHHLMRLAIQEHLDWNRLSAREGRTGVVMGRLGRVGPFLAREDFEDLLVIASMLPLSMVEHITEVALWVDDFRRGYRPRDYQRLDSESRGTLLSYWGLLWSLGHASILCTESWLKEERLGLEINPEALTGLVLSPAILGPNGLTLRITWCMARLGRLALPTLKDVVQRWEATHPTQPSGRGQAALMSLPAVAARHSGLRAEIEKFLWRYVPTSLRADLPRLTEAELIHRVEGLPALPLYATLGIFALREADFPNGHRVMRSIAFYLLEQCAPDTGLRALGEPPEVFTRALPGTTTPLLLDFPLIGTFMQMVPAFARIEPADHFLPRALLERTRGQKEFTTDVDVIRAHLTTLHYLSGRGIPVVRPLLPGRNDPCSCGSGLKFKKCCENRLN